MKKLKFLKRILTFSILLSLLFSEVFFANAITNTVSYPTPTKYKYVNDYVGILNASEINQIISIGEELENKTTAQSVIVIIDSTNNIPISDYANNLFRTWGIGTSDKDNGLLILLAIQDKAWRVEVGRGIEGAIPDVLSNRVMESLAKPSFIEGKYGEGLLNSYSAFSDYIASEYNVTLDKSLNVQMNTSNNNVSSTSGKGTFIIAVVILLLIISDGIFNRGRVFSTLLQILFWSSFHNNHRGPFGGGHTGGGRGGFGGGSSNGGGSSGGW